MATFPGSSAAIIGQATDDFAACVTGSGTAVYVGDNTVYPNWGYVGGSGPFPGVGLRPLPFVGTFPTLTAGFSEAATGTGGTGYTMLSGSLAMVVSWDAGPYLDYYPRGWKSPIWELTAFVPYVTQQYDQWDVYSGGPRIEPLPVADLVCCIPSSVVGADGWGPWGSAPIVPGYSNTYPTLPSPWGGQIDFTESRWALPPRPFSANGWTEKGRVSFGGAGTNVGYGAFSGTSGEWPTTVTSGPGVMNITINLDEDLRDGRLCLVFAVEPWFSGDTGGAPRTNTGVTAADEEHFWTTNEGRVPALPAYATADWSVQAMWLHEPDPLIAIPPLRMRQRWIHGSAHAGQTRAHPVITQAKGDIG